MCSKINLNSGLFSKTNQLICTQKLNFIINLIARIKCKTYFKWISNIHLHIACLITISIAQQKLSIEYIMRFIKYTRAYWLFQAYLHCYFFMFFLKSHTTPFSANIRTRRKCCSDISNKPIYAFVSFQHYIFEIYIYKQLNFTFALHIEFP